jgi:hypothetical protein
MSSTFHGSNLLSPRRTLDSEDPAEVKKLISDAKAFREASLKKQAMLIRRVEELNRTWEPALAQFDEAYEGIITANDSLRFRDAELGNVESHQQHLEILKQESSSDQFTQLDIAPLIELRILQKGEDISSLPRRINELLRKHEKLTADAILSAKERSVAMRRILGLQILRAHMDRNLERNVDSRVNGRRRSVKP